MGAPLTIRYLTGDATKPQAPAPGAPLVIVHCCNDIGGWGAGFVLALSKRWPHVEKEYRRWAAESKGRLELGRVQFVRVADDPETHVANLIGQEGIRAKKGVPPIRYEAIRTGLLAVADFVVPAGASVHMPRMGAGLAGGDWTVIEKIVEETLCARGVHVTVYDFAG